MLPTLLLSLALKWADSNSWNTTYATFYGNPYDDGRKRVCADGRTVYTTYGMFCATGLAPMGSVLEIYRNGQVIRVKVADKQAPRYRHLIDLPTGTWRVFGDPPSVGKIKVRWRVVSVPNQPQRGGAR